MRLVVAEADASSPLASLNGAYFRDQLADFLVVLFVRGHAEALLDFVGYEEAKACVCHDADTDVHSGFRRKTFVPSSNALVETRHDSSR